jgi:antitoxin (DNA-binding transcriptional repressor) of toxin-antitoxin stability system
MQVNMLDAKNQLSKLDTAALAGEKVILASHGRAQVKLVPCASRAALQRPGALLGTSAARDASAALHPCHSPRATEKSGAAAQAGDAMRVKGSTRSISTVAKARGQS